VVSEAAGKPMIYELRVYRCLPGRLPDMLEAFSALTLKVWERVGIKQVGFWTTIVGQSNAELTYMLAWESLADREKKWAAFEADPEFTAGIGAFLKDGPMLASFSNQLLAPTSFSELK
jgi:NIPSNAP